MSTEARIGIVAGLIIVVVASVYFFYGSDKKEADVLVSAGPRFATPPKIPADAEKKTAPASPSAAMAPAGRTAHTPPGVAAAPGAPNQPRPSASLPGGGPPQMGGAAARPPLAGSTDSTGWTAASPAPMGPPEPKAASDSGDDSMFRPPVPLRTGPSPALVEATRENLRKAAEGNDERPLDAGVTPSGARAPGGASPPGGASGNPAPPSETWPKKHRITEGDTLSALADSYYGSSKSLPLILAANPRISDPRALRVGDEITIPEPPKPAATDGSAGKTAAAGLPGATAGPAGAGPTADGGKTYRVREGDSFYSIAAAELADATRWTEIYRLNRELVKDDPKRLRPGMVIKLP